MDEKSREILSRVERGELTPLEAAALLAGTPSPSPSQDPSQAPASWPDRPSPDEGSGPAFSASAPTPIVEENFEEFKTRWKSWWVFPLGAGAGIFALGAIWIAWGEASQRLFWFYCGFFPLLLGLGVMLLSFWSRQAHWLHVRIRSDQSNHGQRIAISLPLPTHLVGWILNKFGRRIPGLREQPGVIDSLPELMAAMDMNGDPLVVEVNDKNGDEVKVYII